MSIDRKGLVPGARGSTIRMRRLKRENKIKENSRNRNIRKEPGSEENKRRRREKVKIEATLKAIFKSCPSAEKGRGEKAW